MSERRVSRRPPEMMNGSTSGSASSNSSTRLMRTGGGAQEMELAGASLERAVGLEVGHAGDEAVARVKHEGVERPLGARAVRRRILRQRQLEERVELDALTAAARVGEDHAPRADVAGAAQAAPGWRDAIQDPEVPLAQIPAAVGA